MSHSKTNKQANQCRNIYKTSRFHSEYSLCVMTLDLLWAQWRTTPILNIHYIFFFLLN